MKKKVLNFNLYVKWLSVVIYVLAALIIWHNRDAIYRHIPGVFLEPIWGIWVLNVILLSIISTIFVCLVQILRCPPLERHKFQKVFRQIGLHNDIGEYPSLLSKKVDCQRAHGRIYKLQNVGIAMESLDNKISQHERSLRLKVYGIEYGRKAKSILIYAIPIKYAKPNVISIHNAAYINELCKLPSILCVGATGAGKSVSLSIILGIYARNMPGISITISDYKHSLLPQLANTPNYYGYEEAVNGISLFYEEFKERLAAHDAERNKQIKVLLIDEYSALLGSQDKKKAEELKTIVGNMLFMSRSLGMKVILGMQTAHAENFKAGARDQFHAILALGNLSKEQKQMLFYDYREKMNEHNGVGEGYLMINGKDVERVKFEGIKDGEAISDIIRPTMYR